MSKKYTETIDSKLKTAWQAVSRMYNAEAIKHGGTIAMAHFLLNINSQEGSYASDIAPRLGTEGTSLSRIIESLEKKKMIVRIPDKTDGRRMKIVLTDKGKKQKEHAKEIVRDFNKLVERKIGKKKVDEFFKIIDKITWLAEDQNKFLNNE
ncbi:MAG TPA: MarR family winged helix-turn-helix transcriptional regulator [Bacteroidia bacterium]|nr:MarR family winged helix-turn-helix transcriptional regulator [Bacteroidia bacterium]